MSVEPRRLRPYQWPLPVLAAAVASFLIFVARQALLRREPFVAWLGAGLAVLFLPVLAWYRSVISLEEEGLRLEGFQREVFLPYREIEGYGYRTVYDGRGAGSTRWLCILGRTGQRIEAAVNFMPPQAHADLLEALRARAPQAARVEVKAPSQLRFGLVVLGTAGVILAASFLVGVISPFTVGEGPLFNAWAAAGLLAGLALGAGVGRRLLPRSPAGGMAAVALCLMTAAPAAALAANFFLAAGPARVAAVSVLSRRVYQDKGKTDRVVDLTIDGEWKRLEVSAGTWELLPEGASLTGCLRPGRLGHPLILSLSRPCPSGLIPGP